MDTQARRFLGPGVAFPIRKGGGGVASLSDPHTPHATTFERVGLRRMIQP